MRLQIVHSSLLWLRHSCWLLIWFAVMPAKTECGWLHHSLPSCRALFRVVYWNMPGKFSRQATTSGLLRTPKNENAICRKGTWRCVFNYCWSVQDHAFSWIWKLVFAVLDLCGYLFICQQAWCYQQWHIHICFTRGSITSFAWRQTTLSQKVDRPVHH